MSKISKSVAKASPKNSNDDGKETRRIVKCYLVKEIDIVECDGGCGEFVIRPRAAPREAEVMCTECYEDELADAADAGADVKRHKVNVDRAQRGVN